MQDTYYLVYEKHGRGGYFTGWVEGCALRCGVRIDGGEDERAFLVGWVEDFEQTIRLRDDEVCVAEVDLSAVRDGAHEDDVTRMVAGEHGISVNGQSVAALHGGDGNVLGYLVFISFKPDAVASAYTEVENGDDGGAFLRIIRAEEVTAEGIRNLIEMKGREDGGVQSGVKRLRRYSDGICKLSEVYAVLAEDVTYFLACDSFLFHVL